MNAIRPEPGGGILALELPPRENVEIFVVTIDISVETHQDRCILSNCDELGGARRDLRRAGSGSKMEFRTRFGGMISATVLFSVTVCIRKY